MRIIISSFALGIGSCLLTSGGFLSYYEGDSVLATVLTLIGFALIGVFYWIILGIFFNQYGEVK